MLTFVGLVYSGVCVFAGWYARGKYATFAAFKDAVKKWFKNLFNDDGPHA